MSSKDLINQHYAYEDPQVEAVMRLQAVKRWHMIETTRTQTLAEHSANVAALAFLVARTCPGMHFGDACNVATYGLVHDMPEVFIGDIPTHSKRWLRKEDLDRAEAIVTPMVFLRPALQSDNSVKLLVKICDLVDGIRFIRIHGCDITSRHAQQGLERQLEEKYGEAYDSWPAEVYAHVYQKTHFYAYEVAGVPTQRGLGSRDGRPVEHDVA